MSNYKNQPELHLHSMDLNDCHNAPEDVCKRIKELEKPGFALTQHGVFSGIENMRVVAEKYGLKFIPGVEAFFDMSVHIGNRDVKKNAHLLMLAKNHKGYVTLCRAGSDRRAQDTSGKTVFNFELLEEYFAEGTEGYNNIIVTSACINGILAVILRANETLENEIGKVERKLEKLYAKTEKNLAELSKEHVSSIIDGTYSEKADSLLAELSYCSEELAQAREEVATMKKLAAKKFTKERKRLEKIGDSPEYIAEAIELRAIIQSGEDAALMLDAAKEGVENLKQKNSALTKVYKLFAESGKSEDEMLKQIASFKDSFKTKEEIHADVINAINHIQQIFGKDNFYIEIQNHGIDMEAGIYPQLVAIARELNIPLVATNDVHTVTNSEKELRRRQILRSMRFDNWEELQTGDDQLYIKDDAEMNDWLGRIYPEDVVTEAMENISVIFDRCNVVFENGQHYPKFRCPEGQTTEQVFRKAVIDGANERFPNGVPKDVKERINYEYKIIRDMGYIDYHLVVKDFLEYGRVLAPVPDEFIADAPLDIDEAKAWVAEHNWSAGFTIGPGRGSAAGSMICYCLGITAINPMEHGLIFERFLNPERISMPKEYWAFSVNPIAQGCA